MRPTFNEDCNRFPPLKDLNSISVSEPDSIVLCLKIVSLAKLGTSEDELQICLIIII